MPPAEVETPGGPDQEEKLLIENQYSAPDHPHEALEPQDYPHGCYRGVVYLTYEEDGHEWTEPVPCRRCSAGEEA